MIVKTMVGRRILNDRESTKTGGGIIIIKTTYFRLKSYRNTIFFFLVLLISPSLVYANQVAVIPLVKNHISAIKPSEVVEMGTTVITPNDT